MIANPLLTGLRLSREPEPFSVVIFGVTGDLTRSKLIPALFSLYLKGNISTFNIIGFARRPWNPPVIQEKVREMIDIPQFANATEEQKRSFLQKVDYIQSTFEEDHGYRSIDEKTKGFPGRLYYLATPPNSYTEVIEHLGNLNLSRERQGFTRIIVEKPFGRDLQSARALNQQISQYFEERQVYRIDHYLGKETVQNIMVLRFGNSIFEPVWNSRHIDHVQITVAEKAGVGTRGNYYEQSGALRDMVQNHVFQLLCLTAMEPPYDLSADAIRGEKVKILKSLVPITRRDVQEHTVRGQYADGVVDGQSVRGYQDEDGVPQGSSTETFVAARLSVENWRWAGVPFFVRSGKRLARKVSEISIHFKEPPHRIFKSAAPVYEHNSLILRIQPDEGVTLNMNAKVPGYTTDMRPVNSDFSYGSSFAEEPPEAYERLLLDALVGDSTLYTRRDEVETSWAFITRILRGWEANESPALPYRAGGSGPEAAKSLIQTDGRRWRKL
jgi:glucose-6-phosphate 1-dehydrogenase